MAEYRLKLPARQPGQIRFEALRVAPHIFWGLPGVGKTAHLRSLADRCYIFIPSERLAIDLCAPSVVEVSTDSGEKKVLRDVPHEWVLEANEAAARGERVLIFLDELTTASDDMEARMLSVINERQVGSERIHRDVAVVAAANPPAIAPGGRPLHLPMVSRLAHYWFEPNYADFGADFASYWGDPPSLPGIDQSCWSSIRADVGSFLLKNPSYVMVFPDIDRVDFEDVRTTIYPCPRTWDNFTRILAAEGLSVRSDEALDVAAATVGERMVVALREWQRLVDIPDIREVLANPREYAVPKRVDSQIALAMHLSIVSPNDAGSALIALARLASKGEKCREFIRPAIFRLVDKITEAGTEIFTNALRSLTQEEVDLMTRVNQEIADLVNRARRGRRR